MNRAAFVAILHDLHGLELEINDTKGEEYCRGEDDVLANFKREGARLDLPPRKILAVHMGKHLDAIYYYLKTGKVLSETLLRRIQDARLYLALLLVMAQEAEDEAPA